LAGPTLHQDLQEIAALQARLPGPLVVLIGAAAAAVVFFPAIWVASQYLNTLAHEGGHAVMGWAVGHKIRSVTMQRSGSGLTMASGSSGLGTFLFQFFGFLGPSAIGLGAAKLIQLGHIIAVLWLMMAALALLLVIARGWVAWAAIIGSGGLLYLTARHAPLGAKVALAYGITWFLLISGVGSVVRDSRVAGGDPDLLRKTTHLPRGLWPPLWLIGTVAALITGARLLI
jgi:hypothetical protein